MQCSSGIQISDLEAIQSDLEQELTIEEAKKVVGGEKVTRIKQLKKIVIVVDSNLTCTASKNKSEKCHIYEPNIILPFNTSADP